MDLSRAGVKRISHRAIGPRFACRSWLNVSHPDVCAATSRPPLLYFAIRLFGFTPCFGCVFFHSSNTFCSSGLRVG